MKCNQVMRRERHVGHHIFPMQRSILPSAHAQAQDIEHLVGRDQLRTERKKGVEILRAREEAWITLQDILGGHVDDETIARDIVRDVPLRDSAALAADDNTELSLRG